jgi:hypothetical protein
MNGHAQTGFYIVLAVVVFGPFITYYIFWYFRRSRLVLQQWAAANGFEITHFEFRSLRTGPFFWTGSGKEAVYYVRVRGKDGRERSGWVRCGTFWVGLFSDRAEVRWEDER